jgi:hypothetical protein
MTAGADRLLTVRWRDRSLVLRAPEQVDELARRLRQKGLAHIAESIRGAVAEDRTAALKVLSDARPRLRVVTPLGGRSRRWRPASVAAAALVRLPEPPHLH